MAGSRQNARGVSAAEACCVCGGGEGQLYPQGHPKWVPPPPTPPPTPAVYKAPSDKELEEQYGIAPKPVVRASALRRLSKRTQVSRASGS